MGLRPDTIPGGPDGKGVTDAASGILLEDIGKSQRRAEKMSSNMRGPRSQEAFLGLVVLLFV